MLNAQFVGYLDIPGKYTVIDSVVFRDSLWLIVKTDAGQEYVLYQVDLGTGKATPVNLEMADETSYTNERIITHEHNN